MFRPLPLSLPAPPGVTLVSGGEEARLTLEPPPVVESEIRRGIELFPGPDVAEATGERKQDTPGPLASMVVSLTAEKSEKYRKHAVHESILPTKSH